MNTIQPGMAMSSTTMMVAAIAQAIKASGAIVRMTPQDFEAILERTDQPLIVCAESGGILLAKKYEYLTGYRGLVFYTKASAPLPLPENAELVKAQQIYIP